MQTLTETYVDRTGWPSGPWDSEPDKMQWRDEATGLPCLIVRGRNGGALCGYVGVSEGHPAYRRKYGEVEVEVHGCLTYANHCAGVICHKVEPGEDDNVWWFGFDCAHDCDKTPGYMTNLSRVFLGDSPDGGGEYRKWDYVKREVESLARQLKAMEAAE